MATILESELEDYLFNWKETQPEKGDSFGIDEHPINVYGKCYRQVEIKGYGIIDLLYIDISPNNTFPQIDIRIVELKKDNIDLSALGQICRYKAGLERFIDTLKDKKGSKYFQNLEMSGILVGSDYATGDICYAVDTIDWLECYHYKLDLGVGITFEESSGWYSTEENFKGLNKYVREWKKKYIELYKGELKYNSLVKRSNAKGAK